MQLKCPEIVSLEIKSRSNKVIDKSCPNMHVPCSTKKRGTDVTTIIFILIQIYEVFNLRW